MALIPFIDSRLEDLHLRQPGLDILLRLREGSAMAWADIWMLCEATEYQLGMAKEEKVGLLVVAFLLIDLGLA